jgi:hypothetical protein
MVRLKIPRNRISDHRIQFSERIALGCDAAATGGIPPRHIASGSRAWLNVKNYFNIIAHTGKYAGWKLASTSERGSMD